MGFSEEKETSVELRCEDNINATQGVVRLEKSDVESWFVERKNESGKLSSRTRPDKGYMKSEKRAETLAYRNDLVNLCSTTC